MWELIFSYDYTYIILGAVIESSMGSGDIPVDFTEEELDEIETLEFSISADLSLPIMDAWVADFEDTNSLLYNARE